jgi:hypothetical protein
MGHPVPRHVQMQAAPREPRMVLNIDSWRFQALGPGNNELSKRFQPAQHAQRILRRQMRLLLRDLQVIALVFTQLLDRRGSLVVLDDQRGLRASRRQLPQAMDRILHPRVRVVRQCDADRRTDRKACLPHFDLGRPRHQARLRLRA